MKNKTWYKNTKQNKYKRNYNLPGGLWQEKQSEHTQKKKRFPGAKKKERKKKLVEKVLYTAKKDYNAYV